MANKRVVTITINADGKEVRETTKDVEKFGDGLHDLDVRQAKEAQEVLKNLGHTDLDQLTRNLREVKMVTSEIDDQQIKNARTSVKELGGEAQRTANVYTDASGRLRDENGKFVKSANDAKHAAEDLGKSVEHTSKQFDKLKDAGASVQNFGNTIQGIGQSLTVGVTLPIVGLAAGIAAVGISYEQALNSFQAVTKATSDEMAQASKVAKELGADVTLPATSAKDAALAMEELGKAGLNASQSMAAAKGVLQLAAAGQLEEAKAAEITANALNSFSLKAEEATRVADLLAAASNASSAGVGDIAEALAQSSASFAAAKVPIEDLTTAIGIMANAGIKGSDAGTSLKTFLSSIQAPADGGATAMEKLGIKVFDAAGKFKGLPTVIGDFEKALSGLTDEEKVQSIQKIFGSDASRAAQILFKEGAAGFEKMKGAVTQAGAAADLAASKTKGVGGAFESLKSQAETIGITIYDAVKGPAEEGLRSLGETLSNVSDYLSNLAQNNPQLIQMGVVFLGIAAAVGPLLVVLGALIVGIGSVITAIGTIGAAWATVSAAVTVAGGVFAALGTVITGTILPALAAIAPVVLTVVAVFAAIGIAAVALYEAWTTNFGNIQGIVSQFVGMVSGAFDSLLSTIQPAVDAVSSYVTEGFNKISEWWATNGPAISQAAQTIFEALLGVVSDALNAIKSFWASNGEWITVFVTEIWNGIKVAIGGAMEAIAGIIKVVTGAINGDWSAVWSGLNSIVNGALHAVAGVIAAGLTAIVGIVGAGLAAVWNLAGFILQEAWKLGKTIVTGIINGITSGIGAIASAAWDLGKRAINSLKEAVDSHSPSREAHKVGEFVGDGFANGIESRSAKVKAVAKKVADETIKQLSDAAKAFNQMAGMSPEQIQRKTDTDNLQKAKSDLGEIIKLRAQLNVNPAEPLPTTIEGVSAQLKFYQDELERTVNKQKSFDKSLDDMRKGADATREDIQKYAESVAKLKENLSQDGTNESRHLQQEIELLGVTDDVEKERIKNAYELIALREQLKNDGYGESAIKEALAIKAASQTDNLELVRQKSDKSKEVEAAKKVADEQKKVAEEAQKQIDAIAGRIQDSLNNIFTAFRGGFKKGLSAIWGEIKGFFGSIVSNLTQTLSKSLSQMLTKALFGGGSNGSSSGGGIGSFISNIFGGGSNNSSSAGGGIGSIISGLFGGGGGSNSGGSSGGGIGSIISGLFGGGQQRNGAHIGYGFGTSSSGATSSGGGALSQLFSSQGISSALASGGITAAIAMAQIALTTHNPLVGLATGGLIGLGVGFLNREIRRKREEKLRTTAYVNAMGDLDKIRLSLERRPPGMNWETGINNAKQIQSDYYAQVNALKDNKTRKIALKTGKDAIDPRVAQVEVAAAAARVYEYNRGQTAKDFVGEFANGVYMDSSFRNQYDGFKRHNGLMSGAYTGRDYIKALIGDGEIVANPMQLNNMRRAAGFDVVAHAGLPNYRPKGGDAEPPRFASGVSFAAPVFTSSNSNNNSSKQPDTVNVSVHIDGLKETVRVELDSPTGKKIVIGHVTAYVNEGGRG